MVWTWSYRKESNIATLPATFKNCVPKQHLRSQYWLKDWCALGNDKSKWLTDVFRTYGDGTTQLSDKLFGVQPDLDNIVEQSKERGKREWGHKQRHKAKLDDWERQKERERGRTNVSLLDVADVSLRTHSLLFNKYCFAQPLICKVESYISQTLNSYSLHHCITLDLRLKCKCKHIKCPSVKGRHLVSLMTCH